MGYLYQSENDEEEDDKIADGEFVAIASSWIVPLGDIEMTTSSETVASPFFSQS
jgi:hypothetical protein